MHIQNNDFVKTVKLVIIILQNNVASRILSYFQYVLPKIRFSPRAFMTSQQPYFFGPLAFTSYYHTPDNSACELTFSQTNFSKIIIIFVIEIYKQETFLEMKERLFAVIIVCEEGPQYFKSSQT